MSGGDRGPSPDPARGPDGEPGGGAPAPASRPPDRFTDRRGREIRLVELASDELDVLEPMYDAYDPRDRAQGIPPATPAGVRRWLDGLGEALHVAALHGDRAVGHAFLASGPDGRSAELAIFVDGPYQDAGIGTRLMEALLGLGAHRGIRRVWLVVQRANGPAVRLYRKTGFRVVDAGRAELEMERELEAPDD